MMQATRTNKAPASATTRSKITNQPARLAGIDVRSSDEALSEEDRHDVLDQLIEMLRPIPPHAGEVLDAIVKLLPRRKDWTAQHLREDVTEKGSRRQSYAPLRAFNLCMIEH
jgi:hypothetical protein